MTEDPGRLRQAMSDLSEHGGSTDLYERTLHKSRQLQRRTAVATGAAAVAVVFAIGGAVTLAAGGPGPSTPVATQPPLISVAPTSAPPSAPTSAPTSAPPSAASTTPHSSTPTSKRPQYPDCPSAKSLERLVDLPKDWYIVPSSVQCWRTWATAEPDGPDRGDGFYLFQYKPGTGWRYHSAGSGFHCADLGITSGNPPFCDMN